MTTRLKSTLSLCEFGKDKAMKNRRMKKLIRDSFDCHRAAVKALYDALPTNP